MYGLFPQPPNSNNAGLRPPRADDTLSKDTATEQRLWVLEHRLWQLERDYYAIKDVLRDVLEDDLRRLRGERKVIARTRRL